MPKIQYITWNPNSDTIAIVDKANEILEEYVQQGYDLSLRQLYYQFVARDIIPNTQKSYDRLGRIVSQARDAGMIDWSRIQDRGRATHSLPHWASGEDFLQNVAPQFNLDRWEGQSTRCQVWVEKDALSGIVARAATAWDVAYFANKGYVSSSAIWAAAQYFLHSECDHWVILHLGDHDPSGIDMSRDIEKRLNLYTSRPEYGQTSVEIEVRRIALNMDQVLSYSPPPNPAKMTDPRSKDYRREFGNDSWELDALEPNVIVTLIEEEIQDVLEDHDKWYDVDEKTIGIRVALGEVEL